MNKQEMMFQLDDLRKNMHEYVETMYSIALDLIQNQSSNVTTQYEHPTTRHLIGDMSYFKSRKPISIRFENGRTINTSNWKVVASEILKDCNSTQEGHKTLYDMRNKVWGRSRVILSDNNSNMDIPLKIDEGLYFEAKFDTQSMLNVLINRILTPANYDASKIEIETISPSPQYLKQETVSPIHQDSIDEDETEDFIMEM